MKVIDIDKEIAKMGKSKPIICEIKDSQRIKTSYVIAREFMDAFGIEERNKYTIMQLGQTVDEDAEDNEGSEQEMQYDEDDKDKVHYYAFEKDCCCGLLRLGKNKTDENKTDENTNTYLYIEPRFQPNKGMDICSMLEKVAQSNLLWEKCLRKCDGILYDDIPKEYKEKLCDSEGKRLNDESENIPCCAVSMSVLFELYAGAMVNAMVKSFFSEWECHLGEGKANLLPTAKDKYKYYIAGEVIPDIVLEKDGKYIILDVKYKDCDNPNRDDRLQLLAYADVYDAHVIGHVFPAKGNECDFRSGKLNTQLGTNYHYLQFCLDDSGNVPPELNDKIKKVIEDAGLM